MKITRSEQLYPGKTTTIYSNLEKNNTHSTGITTYNTPYLGSEKLGSSSEKENPIINCDTVLSPGNYIFSKYSSSLSSSSNVSSDDTLNKEETWGGLKNIPTGPLTRTSNKRVKIPKAAKMKVLATIPQELEHISFVTNDIKKRRTKYLEACPEIDRILSKTCTRSSKTILLQNGNLTTPCKMNKKTFIVSNTCAFDSLVFGIAMAYTDFPSYHVYINSKNIEFFNFIVEIVNHGSSIKIYNSRLKLLNTIFKSVNYINNVHLLNAECNVSFIINGLLREVPSCI